MSAARRSALLLLATCALAAAEVDGAALYAQRCVVCHGASGEGNPVLQSPVIAGQRAAYLRRQLRHFRDGVRGGHADDAFGAQMRAQAADLEDDAIQALAAHVESLPVPARTDPPSGGDATEGAARWQHCAGCHGERGEGSAVFLAPRLTHQHGWYLERQLLHYRRGIRGSHPEDRAGPSMQQRVLAVGDEETLRDLAAWLHALGP